MTLNRALAEPADTATPSLAAARAQFERQRHAMLVAWRGALRAGLTGEEAATEAQTTAAAMRQLAAAESGR